MNKNISNTFNPLALVGKPIPKLALPSTEGRMIDLSLPLSRFTVLYAYPRTSRPGFSSLKDWDIIPGAKGCTLQSCAFRDHYRELNRLSANVFGLSTQNTEYQIESAKRLSLPFPLLSDEKLSFAQAIGLPTFEVEDYTLLCRLTSIIENSRIKHVMYPVSKPETNAMEVIALLSK